MDIDALYNALFRKREEEPLPPLYGFAKGGAAPPELAGQGGELWGYTPNLREKLTAALARNWYGDTREGYSQAGRLMDVAEMTPLGVATGIYDAGREAGAGNLATAGIMGGLAMAPIPGSLKKDAKAGIKAFHGSPHSFDKFDLSKIGTGEGAQAYGHGLYFAEGEGVAKGYRDNVKDMAAVKKVNTRLSELARIMHADEAGGYRNFKSDTGRNAAAEYDALMQERSSISNAPGHMYEVNIDADPNQFLDWDKPLSEQGAAVKEFVQKTYPTGKTPWGFDMANATGQDFLRASKTEKNLSEAGIPGVKYLDAGSRAKGDGSRNYVVFDDKLISIVRKYGIAGASALLGYDLMANVDPAQAAQLKAAAQGQ